MSHTAGPAELKQLLAHLDQVGGRSGGLERRIESPLAPRAVGSHARGAATGVASLGLDASDGEHRLAAYVDGVAPEGKCEQRILWQS